MNRRDFLKWAGFVGAGAALPVWAKQKLPPLRLDEREPLPEHGLESWRRGRCGTCPAGCGWLARWVDGRPVGVRGDPEDPASLGALCPRGLALVQEHHHSALLRVPLVSDGSGLKRATWEQAYARIERELRASGARPVAVTSGLRGWQDAASAAAGLGGEAYLLSWTPSEPARDAFSVMHGRGDLEYDLGDEDLVVSFGWDWLQAWPEPVAAQRAYGRLRSGRPGRRARLLSVEPRLSVTAAKADRWIPVAPGGHGWAALAVAGLLVQEARVEPAGGAWSLRDLGRAGMGPAECARRAGLDLREAEALAREIALSKAVQVMTWRGSFFDQLAVHALHLIANRGRPRLHPGTGPVLKPGADLPESDVARGAPLLLDRVNPCYGEPGGCAAWREFIGGSPFTVAVASILDETAALADVVLPAPAPLDDTAPPPWEAVSRRLGGRGGARGQAPAKPATGRIQADLLLASAPQAGSPGPRLLAYAPLAFPRAEGAHLPYLAIAAGFDGPWESVADLHPSAARQAGVHDGERVVLESDSGRIPARARVTEGIHPEALALRLGFGRTLPGPDPQGADRHGDGPLSLWPRRLDESTRQAAWDPVPVRLIRGEG